MTRTSRITEICLGSLNPKTTWIPFLVGQGASTQTNSAFTLHTKCWGAQDSFTLHPSTLLHVPQHHPCCSSQVFWTKSELLERPTKVFLWARSVQEKHCKDLLGDHVIFWQLKANTFRDFVSYIKQINRKDKNSSGRKRHIDVQGCFTVAWFKTMTWIPLPCSRASSSRTCKWRIDKNLSQHPLFPAHPAGPLRKRLVSPLWDFGFAHSIHECQGRRQCRTTSPVS